MVAYCGWDPTVMLTGVASTFDGDGTQLLLLPCLNVTAVVSVTFTNDDGTTTVQVVGPGGISWKPNGELISYCGWPVGSQNITVVWSGGYDGPPNDLQAALDSFGARTAGPLGMQSQKMGTASVTLGATIAAGGMLLVEQMVFDRYRIPRVA